MFQKIWIYPLLFGAPLLALFYIIFAYRKIKQLPEGPTDPNELGYDLAAVAAIIRDGAATFMWTEYKTILPVTAILAAIFSLFIEVSSGFTFLIGALMSSIVCIVGMRTVTYANVRTANIARLTKSANQTVQIALLGGSVAGVGVQLFGLLGLSTVLIGFGSLDPVAHNGHGLLAGMNCNPFMMRITTYSLGCSVVAMFNRVAGGNYTKAADISSDILAKLRHDLPEDDARVPNVIADFIGDSVNDIAGNCSDLLESFVATIAASLMIAITVYNGVDETVFAPTFAATCLFPLVLAAGGLLACAATIAYFALGKRAASDNPARELNLATYWSAGLTVLAGLIACRVLFGDIPLYESFILGWISPWFSTLLGIGSGVMIGVITEYYTSAEFKPTRALAEIATEGEAFVITKGDAIGSRSCLAPILVIGVALFASGHLCGTYGIALSALGMLSFVATIVSIDAFGPIADNAGGLAESCHLDPVVRTVTDRLDAVGNTTAAVGKGFAIGSAAFATVSMIVAYVSNYATVASEPTLNIASYVVIAGAIIGGALIEYFSALLTDHTIESARIMADVGDQELSKPGVLSGEIRPDYNKCVELAATEALRKMLAPSIIALLVPILGGLMFGVEFVGGLLIGATIVAIPRALFMSNSGGAFDNAKKFIEAGSLVGCPVGSRAYRAPHRASVTGDTVGDTRKDVVGVALDIFIKTMSTVANTLAPIFAGISLF